MQRQIITTADGSHTIRIAETAITYHSIHGALQESMHVFINAGFQSVASSHNELHVLEIGLGTGLNALLSFAESQKLQKKIYYTAVEPFPLTANEVNALNYTEQMHKPVLKNVFSIIHSSKWEEDIAIAPAFTLHKMRQSLLDVTLPQEHYHLVYFDAFAPAVQPELWTEEVFQQLYNTMYPGAVLVTYCSKGNVRRNMQQAGFMIEKPPGPPGKREMIRARK
ncbi:MAG: tRNA (5-methylaminomethyl-2-thiouridine)(34)-methyltransferase MnmD [Agriterribacter sp.]